MPTRVNHAKLVELIKNSICVDDLLTGANSVKLCQQSKELIAKGAFNLRKWKSDSTDLLQLINNKEEGVV